MRNIILCAMLLLSLTGCHQKIVQNGIVVYEVWWNRAASEVKAQASIEMRCPASHLYLSLISRHGKYPNKIAVEGCGIQDVYVRHKHDWYSMSGGGRPVRNNNQSIIINNQIINN